MILEAKPLIVKLKKTLLRMRRKIKGRIALVSLQLTKDAATCSYIASQKKWADALGVEYRLLRLTGSRTRHDIIAKIESFNHRPYVKGIIIHKPLPRGWREESLFDHIHPRKDVEGLSSVNLGLIMQGRPLLIPPTARSVLALIDYTVKKIEGKQVVLVGYSNLVNKPLSVILADRLATVSIAHIGTYRAGALQTLVKGADILVTAVGKENLIKGSWIKKGALVIDAGICKGRKGITGDVEFKPAARRASMITPVPGGVGTLTVGFLYHNLLSSSSCFASQKKGHRR